MSRAEPLALPPGIEAAFLLAASELGMCSAAWLFAREVAAVGGDALVARMRDELGRAFPVLDHVAARWLAGARGPDVDPAAVLAACAGAARVVVVGLETAFLDALVARLDRDVRVALLTRWGPEADWERVLANYAGRVEATDLGGFQRWAGRRSALLGFVYGADAHNAHVPPAWPRVIGGDVRSQFRHIVGWDVLRGPMFVYPRWLVEAPAGDFSQIV